VNTTRPVLSTFDKLSVNTVEGTFLPFELIIPLPTPRKAGKILESDEKGRIVYSQP